MENQYSFKELFDVFILAQTPLKLNGRDIEPGETIFSLDKVQMAFLTQNNKFYNSTGGFDNREFVWWEQQNELNIRLNQGIMSSTQLGFFNNSKIFKKIDEEIFIPIQEKLESNEEGLIIFNEKVWTPFFIYNWDTGEKITNYSVIDDVTINVGAPYTVFLVNYFIRKVTNYGQINFGDQINNYYFSLYGKTKVKDDVTGSVHLGLITIPKFRFRGNFNINLGELASPVLNNLEVVAIPYGAKGRELVMRFQIMEDEINE